MKITRQSIIYDICNLAYVIADCDDSEKHSLHQLRDVCEEGNIDRVARVLGLAYADILAVLMPVITSPEFDINRDSSASPHDYIFCFREDEPFGRILTKEVILKIKETAREYMVCMVLSDWLGITLPDKAEPWKIRSRDALESLKTTVKTALNPSVAYFRRAIEIM